MLQKPDIQDERLIACLYDGYGLRAAQLTFLPLGADVNTAVYRVGASDGGAYFLKLRRGPFDEMSVAIPRFLADQGIAQIIAPLRTTAGDLWSSLDPFTLTLYPFVAGADGYTVVLSEQQWIEFGAALMRIHTAGLPPALQRGLPRETYSPRWREEVRAFLARSGAGAYTDRLSAELAAFLQEEAAAIRQLVEAAEQLGRMLLNRAQERVLCHADIHAGNLLIGSDGSLHIVDWDTALLAPKERDLMFVGSGLGPGWDQDRETAWFYAGYGPAEIDPAALAYYRCERLVQDVAEFCKQIVATTGGNEDRRQALRWLISNFEPNGVFDIAMRSWRGCQGMEEP